MYVHILLLCHVFVIVCSPFMLMSVPILKCTPAYSLDFQLPTLLDHVQHFWYIMLKICIRVLHIALLFLTILMTQFGLKFIHKGCRQTKDRYRRQHKKLREESRKFRSGEIQPPDGTSGMTEW